MRTSHKAKDAAAEKQSYACDSFTGYGKAHQPPLPGSPVRVFPVMLLGATDLGAAVDLVRGGGGADCLKATARCREPGAQIGGSMCGHERAWSGPARVVRQGQPMG
jgi:hypothetical protein